MKGTKGSHGGHGGHGVAEYSLQCLRIVKRSASPWWGPISERTGVPKPHTAKRGRLADATLPFAFGPIAGHRTAVNNGHSFVATMIDGDLEGYRSVAAELSSFYRSMRPRGEHVRSRAIQLRPGKRHKSDSTEAVPPGERRNGLDHGTHNPEAGKAI
jgi:hypothetical protein